MTIVVLKVTKNEVCKKRWKGPF